MSSHSIHPDSHEFGLADDCERCDEHAAHPFDSLDDDNLRVLIERVRNKQASRSKNEDNAMYEVREALRIRDRINKIEGGSA